ncbi:hypothetical protein [Paucibacter sp. XJ19-41]|uniref:hypothetical protein n=1 Tax=Paucibacter sp. XJ19-41 TaxID=2927824 RepID=UPI00234900E8|nr:hypothetical protein [Paucibacter sp. XJ19-41]MDC6166712.1 hypothetical protein [Paucibacter sp. XJ19-41]
MIDKIVEQGYGALARADEHAEAYRQLRLDNLKHDQAIQRRCQELSPDMYMPLGPLLKRGIEGGVPGAASEYWFLRRQGLVGEREISDEVLRAALIRDARLGHGSTLSELVFFGDSLGLSAVELRGYELFMEMLKQRGRPHLQTRDDMGQLLPEMLVAAKAPEWVIEAFQAAVRTMSGLRSLPPEKEAEARKLAHEFLREWQQSTEAQNIAQPR